MLLQRCLMTGVGGRSESVRWTQCDGQIDQHTLYIRSCNQKVASGWSPLDAHFSGSTQFTPSDQKYHRKSWLRKSSTPTPRTMRSGLATSDEAGLLYLQRSACDSAIVCCAQLYSTISRCTTCCSLTLETRWPKNRSKALKSHAPMILTSTDILSNKDRRLPLMTMRSYIDAHSVEQSDNAKACLQTCHDADNNLLDGDASLWQSVAV